MFENLLTHTENRIQHIIINRESKLNALNKETLAELHTAIYDAFNNDNVGGIIITGAGQKAFVAGADIAEFASFDSAKGEQLARNGHRMFLTMIENAANLSSLLSMALLWAADWNWRWPAISALRPTTPKWVCPKSVWV